MKRRDFFKSVAGVVGAVAVAPVLLTSLQAKAERKKEAGAEMVDVKDNMAKTVGYVEKSKVAGKSCANCMLYNKTGENKGKEIGTCAIFPGKHVYADAYCNSYAKKA